MDDMVQNHAIFGAPFEFSKEYVDVGDQTPVQIPGGVHSIVFTLTPAAGTSKIQSSTSTEAELLAGTATWEDHPDGAVGNQLQDVMAPVSAVRVVIVAGTAKLSMRAQ